MGFLPAMGGKRMAMNARKKSAQDIILFGILGKTRTRDKFGEILRQRWGGIECVVVASAD